MRTIITSIGIVILLLILVAMTLIIADNAVAQYSSPTSYRLQPIRTTWKQDRLEKSEGVKLSSSIREVPKPKIITDPKEYINTHTTGEKRDWLLRVGQCESGFRPDAVAYQSIVHCRQTNGTYTAGVDSCASGVEVHRENASGVFQILPSSWKMWGCEGDIFNGIDNTKCAMQAYDRGFGYQWACK